MFANAFKPYLGFGYSGAVDKQKRLNVGVEAGVLLWGGVPNVVLHDGISMTKDLVNVRGGCAAISILSRLCPYTHA